MDTQQQEVPPILEGAWRKFSEFDAVSVKHTASYVRLRQWIAVFGVLATLFAIISGNYAQYLSPLTAFILKLLLVISPITASVIAAYTNKFFATGDWLILRAGAEETLKNIYYFRTILQNNPKRRDWLEGKLSDGQRSVYRGMNGELVIAPYNGPLPPASRFDPKYPSSDPGFHDLTGEEYFNFRLENELNWHVKKVNQKQKERIRLQVLILLSGAAGAILAALGAGFAIWVALTASLTTTFLGWQELKNLDLIVRNYSKVILELSIIADHWKNLTPAEQTQSEFYKMVNFTEDMLWSRNVEYIKAMQEALKDSGLKEEASMINRIIDEQVAADHQFKQNMEDAVVGQTKTTLEDSVESLSNEFEKSLGSLADEASSDLVQAELAAMKDAVHNMVENMMQKVGLTNSLQSISDQYQGVDISGNTPKTVLNDLLSRYPKTNDVKG